jgi:hypothetical protein
VAATNVSYLVNRAAGALCWHFMVYGQQMSTELWFYFLLGLFFGILLSPAEETDDKT